MKRVLSLILALTLTLALAACGGKGGWQEQYDLGQKYLTEGNYEEAIMAFTAAIGSMKSVAPEADTSCTSPGTEFLNSALTGTTYLSERVVIIGS